MPNPIDRKRLKKRMLDRWENEGGKIAADTTTPNDTSATSEDKEHDPMRPPSDAVTHEREVMKGDATEDGPTPLADFD